MAITKLNSLAIPPNTIVESDLSYPLTNFSSTGIDDNATSTAITIDASENVGIGTTSPTTALTVSTDGTEQITINRADASINAGNTVGTILFTGDDPSANQIGAKIQVLASENWATNAYGSHITFSNDSSGTLTERMRIDSSGNVDLYQGNNLTWRFAAGSTIRGSMSIDSADNITFSNGSSNTERMRIDSSGRLLLNTTDATTGGLNPTVNFKQLSNASYHRGMIIESADSDAFIGIGYSGSEFQIGASYRASAGYKPITVVAGGYERMRIDTSGNVGIGTTSPSGKLHVVGGPAYLYVSDSRGSQGAHYIASNGTSGQNMFISANVGGISGGDMVFLNGGTERMRMDDNGNLLIGKTAQTTNYQLEVDSTGGAAVFYRKATGTGAVMSIYSNNYGTESIAAYFRSNGGLSNYSSNDTNLSDQRAKKDIVDSGNYLEKLCNIPVRNFRYNEDAENGKHHLGVIAQEVEAVAPEFVNKASWEHKDGPMDTVYNTDLMFAMMKSIQELSAQVDELKAEVAALKGA